MRHSSNLILLLQDFTLSVIAEEKDLFLLTVALESVCFTTMSDDRQFGFGTSACRFFKVFYFET